MDLNINNYKKQKLSYIRKNKAFTLAEVLITLVIIGVIAAITVPILHSSYKKQETVSRLKKAYSTIQQSTYKIALKEGLPVGDFSFMQDDDFFHAFKETVNRNKVCEIKPDECFPDVIIKRLNGADSYNFNRNFSIVTMDGTAYGWTAAGFQGNPNFCGDKYLTPEETSKCIGRFIVDINGHANPNRIGHDVFFFVAVNGKGIVPAGSGGTEDCKRDSFGNSCAAKVLKDNDVKY